MHSGPQRFYEYLDCLQEEFERRSNDTLTKDLGPCHFNIYLGNLKGEFEFMSLEIESLRRARDQYKEKSKCCHYDHEVFVIIIQSRHKRRSSRMFAEVRE